MEQALEPELAPYGAWYTQPGGMDYHPPEAVAPAVDAARTTLLQLRNSPEVEPKVSFLKFIVLQFSAGAMQLAILAWYMGVGNRLTDRPVVIIYALPLVIVAALFSGIYHIVRPPSRSPEAMFRHYFGRAMGPGRRGSYLLLLQGDHNRESPRSAIPGSKAKGPFQFRTRDGFLDYWKSRLGATTWLLTMARVSNLRSVRVGTDAAVVQATVTARTRRYWLVFAGLGPLFATVAIALSGILGRERITPDGVKQSIVVLFVGLGLWCVTLLIFIFWRTTSRFIVRKVLVLVNGQWRIFNGELQGPEERDVSWLLQPQE